MDKKILIIGLIIGLVLGSIIGAVSLTGQLSSLQAKASILEATADKVPGLETQVTQLKAEAEKVPGLQQQVTSLKTDADKVPSLQQQIASLSAQVTTLTSQKASLQSQINDLQSQVSQLQASDEYQALAQKDAEISQLNQQIGDLNSQIQTLQTQVVSLQTQLAAQQSGGGTVSVIAVSFARVEDTSSLLCYWIGRANHTIRVAVYCFTQDALGDAIIAAKNRGIDVEVYIDDQYVSSTGSEYPRLQAAGVPIKADTRSADMHHKFIVIDSAVVGTGSYNWSQSAEDANDENLILLRSVDVAQEYLSEFNRLWG